MKKISLFLFTLCVSVASWAQTNNTAGLEYTLNPYAYDLKIKSWDPASRILTVQFKLNSPPNLNGASYNSVTDGEPNGIQIYAVDQQGNEYRIGGPGRTDIQNCIKNGYLDFTMDLGAGTSIDGTGPVKNIPVDEILTWKVRVKGRNSGEDSGGASVAAPRRVTVRPADKRPRHPLGVAVGTNPYAPNFGKILITQPGNGYNNTMVNGNVENLDGGTWDWLYHELMISYTAFNGTQVTRTPAVLEYSPQFKYQTLYRKYKHDNTDKSYFSSGIYTEPHRVRISEDGRIFVSSYHPTAGAAVLEYMGDNTFKTVVQFDVAKNEDVAGYATNKYNRRVADFDVKGSGGDLKVLVAWVKPRYSTYTSGNGQGRWYSKVECIEYHVGLNNYNISQDDGKVVAVYTDKGTATGGLIYRGFEGGNATGNNSSYSAGNLGFIGVTYGKGENNPIWLKVDFAIGTEFPGRVLYFDNTGGNPTKEKKYVAMATTDYVSTGYWGGNAIAATEDQLIISIGGYICFYTINDIPASGNLPTPTTKFPLNTNTAWYNGMAIDYANNLYVVSEYNGDVYTLPLPYSGTIETPAPKNSTFSLSQPVPNILATDLKCVGHETKPKYVFSFNVNTKPEYAEIRFYRDEQVMLNNTKANENFSELGQHGNCDYYYVIPRDNCKQGRMSVELDILGHEGGQELTDKKLPEGKLYWNVYLKTCKSTSFAPIYVQPIEGDDLHYRLHATIDNNPDNDGFGHIYAVDYKKDKTDSEMKNNPCWLMVYSIGENITNNSNRYSKIQHLTANDMVQPRRPAVAPDGMVYLTDYGDYRSGANFNSNGNGPMEFLYGGIWLFDPKDPLKNGSTTEAKLSRFYDKHETTSDVCFFHDGNELKLYKTNTYEEFNHHSEDKVDVPYGEERWMRNGYRIYTMGYNQDGTLKHQMSLESAPVIPFKVYDEINEKYVGGDANGNISIVATSDGVWFCQNRKGKVVGNDNRQNVALMFYDNDKNRVFQSYLYGGGRLSQYSTSEMKSTPGGGMAVSPDEKYLYVVNHDGDILEFEIGEGGKTLTLNNKFDNTTAYSGISTMDFDYAGNLVVTTDEDYPADASEHTQIVVFTMPYNRDNARTIPASKSERLVPERLSQDLDNSTTLAKEGTYDVELYRPLQGATFNTICLPFEVDLTTLPAAHKLYGATVMDFTSVSTPSVGNETVLSLNFTKVDKMLAGKPYIIYVEDHVRGLIEFSQVTRKNTVVPQSVVWNVQNSSIAYTGVFNPTEIGEGNTILVDQNRLANVTNEGTLSGFRGYFTIPESLRSLKAMISTKHDTPTGLEDMNITERTYQKFLREGRVFIRVGESLYTVDGQLVK